MVYTESTFDNTVNNPNNPNDPPENVYWGPKTEDEMNILSTQELTYVSGDEYFLLDSSLLVATGIEDDLHSNVLPSRSAYPNPASDRVQLVLHHPGLDEIDFKLMDISGKEVLHFTRDAHQLSLVQFTFSVKDLSDFGRIPGDHPISSGLKKF